MTHSELEGQNLSREDLEKRYLECRDHLRAIMQEHVAFTDSYDAAIRWLCLTSPEIA